MKSTISFLFAALLSLVIALFTVLGGFTQLFNQTDPLTEVFIFSLSFATTCLFAWAATTELTQTLRSREVKSTSKPTQF